MILCMWRAKHGATSKHRLYNDNGLAQISGVALRLNAAPHYWSAAGRLGYDDDFLPPFIRERHG
jgi:hypothetical protein